MYRLRPGLNPNDSRVFLDLALMLPSKVVARRQHRGILPSRPPTPFLMVCLQRAAQERRNGEREREIGGMCVCVCVFVFSVGPFFTTCCSLPDLTLLPFLSENVGLGYSGVVERADSVCDFPDMRDLRKGGSPNKKQLTPTIMEIPIKAPQISVQQCR